MRKCFVLLDSGSSGSIIIKKYVKMFSIHLKHANLFNLNEFYENHQVEWNFHVDSSPGPYRYDMIVISHDLLSELGILLDFKIQMMTWDESTIKMKDPEILSQLLAPINDFYWHEECMETQALHDATSHLKKI